MLAHAVVDAVVASVTDRFEIVRIQRPRRVVFEVDDVVHLCRPVYLALCRWQWVVPGSYEALPAFLTFVMVAPHDVGLHVPPC